jgi:hypothetical protein
MRAWTVSWVRLATVIALAASGAAACSEDTDDDRVGLAGDDLAPPPAVRVHYGDESIVLRPSTWCYRSTCVDGPPPPNPREVGSPEQIVVEYPLDRWRFSASFRPTGEPCPRSFPARLEETAPGRFVLNPVGYADDYDVHLFGQGPEGDASTTFRWTTTSDGPLPTPSAYVGIIAASEGQISSYGVEMQVMNVGVALDHVHARITVTAADGDSLTFSPRPDDECRADGQLFWDGPAAKGKQTARLGPAPFTYDVDLTLDGRTYEAVATWPDDLIPNYKPYVRLHFSPALPALNLAPGNRGDR